MSSRTGEPIVFFFDENVSHRLREYLIERGHRVILSTDYLAAGTVDQIVASVAVRSPMILVTHDRDFRRFKELLAKSDQTWIAKGSGKLQLSVHQSVSVQRVDREIDMIEFHYQRCLSRGTPFYMEIKDSLVRVIEG